VTIKVSVDPPHKGSDAKWASQGHAVGTASQTENQLASLESPKWATGMKKTVRVSQVGKLHLPAQAPGGELANGLSGRSER
jgi:hypothetical protein